MTRLSLKNPIAILMICIALVVFAMVVMPRLSIDTFPELTPPVLVVGTQAPGLGPKDVEKTITWRVEKYVSATPGVDHVESKSLNGLSIVTVWFKWGTDLNSAQVIAQQQVTFAMAAVPKSLGVLPPFVLQYDPSNAPVVQVAVYGKGFTGAQLYDYAFNNIEPVLEGISGVASAAVNGGTVRQINVVVDPRKAQARGLSTQDVAAAVQQSNALLPSGEFLSPNFDANVYTNAVPSKVETIGEAAVKVVNGRPVLIKDVAQVLDGGAPRTNSVNVDGQDGVYLNVLRTPGGNTLEIVDAIKAAVGRLANLPPGLKVVPVFDQSTFVRTSYNGLKTEILRALVLIALVILLFLQSLRGTLIVSVAIPLSFAITLIILYMTGNTLNAFTLGGLTLAMGRLVDDAVVVLESIHRHQKNGMDPYHAALSGANAVALPVLASTVTTICVLLPVVLLEGLAKKLFAPLALTVTIAMIASYFVSMAVTPVACRYLLKHVHPGPFATRLENAIAGTANGYASLLGRVIVYRKLVLVIAGVLVTFSVILAGRLPSTFFPEIDESMGTIYVRFAPGISLMDANQRINDMGRVLKEEMGGQVDLVLTNLGLPGTARSAIYSPNPGPNSGFIQMAMADVEKRRPLGWAPPSPKVGVEGGTKREQRERGVPPFQSRPSQQEIADQARTILNRHFPGVEFVQSPGGLVASVFANGFFAPVVVEVRNANLNQLRDQLLDVASVARGVAGIADLYPSVQVDYPEVHVETNRQEAAQVNVSARLIAQTTLESTFGNINTPSVWVDQGNGQTYYVVTSYKNISDPAKLMAVPALMDKAGRTVTLGAYATARRGLGPLMVERNSMERAGHLIMQTQGRDIGSTASELEHRLNTDPRTRNLKWHFSGEVALMRRTFSGLGLAIGLAVMLVFMIMASQFKSLRLPFVMLFTIPVTLVGIVMALMAAGQGFSITAMMGILMVVGIAVSNGILMVDDANRRLMEGNDKLTAIIEAARSRFVPIAMTSLATIIGLIPTALALEHGTESNQPLALAVVGGLTSSTILSLFLVPVIFLILAKEPGQAEGGAS